MTRRRLPNRRRSQTFELQVDGLRYICTVSYFDDGRIGELFLNNHKSNSDADCNARDAAVVCSIALQFGVPLDVIRRALMRDSHGRATGPLGHGARSYRWGALMKREAIDERSSHARFRFRPQEGHRA